MLPSNSSRKNKAATEGHITVGRSKVSRLHDNCFPALMRRRCSEEESQQCKYLSTFLEGAKVHLQSFIIWPQ